MPPDRIPDPRDRTEPIDLDMVLADNHPTSLAAFEAWCQQVSARSALDYIRRYRVEINSHVRRQAARAIDE